MMTVNDADTVTVVAACIGIMTAWYILKNLKYHFEGQYRKHRAYIDLMAETIPFINKIICRLPFPVDVNKAYGEGYDGIYAFS